jgi:hypothetical protein
VLRGPGGDTEPFPLGVSPRLRRRRGARRHVWRAGGRRRAAAPGLHGRRGRADHRGETRIGSVKAPKQVLIWPGLPRSTVGKVRAAGDVAHRGCRRLPRPQDVRTGLRAAERDGLRRAGGVSTAPVPSPRPCCRKRLRTEQESSYSAEGPVRSTGSSQRLLRRETMPPWRPRARSNPAHAAHTGPAWPTCASTSSPLATSIPAGPMNVNLFIILVGLQPAVVQQSIRGRSVWWCRVAGSWPPDLRV